MGTLQEIFLKGGWVMWPLLIFSIFSWAVVLERTFVFLTLKPKISKLIEAIQQCLKSKDLSSAKQLCRQEKPFLGEMFLGSLETKKNRSERERLIERGRMRLSAYLKKNLWVLGTIGSASPFVGLLGTVLGIVRAFHEIQSKGTAGITVVGAGISEALIATAAGLIVAIIALLTYNIFVTASNQLVSALKITIDEIVDFAEDSSTAQG